MKMLLSVRGLFMLGFAILLATNIVVLSGVASNRSGKPDTQIILTERELRLPSRISSENSGLRLKITWRVLEEDTGYDNYSGWQSPEWFDAEKLEVLGFNVDIHDRAMRSDISYRHELPKEVFVVLEYDGETYKEAFNRAEYRLEKARDTISPSDTDAKRRKEVEKAANQLSRERFSTSRLFAIDVGLNPDILREKYQDQAHFIITKGLAAAKRYYDKNKKEVTGTIKGLSIKNIHVPLKHRQVFDTLLGKGIRKWNAPDPPRYQVELGYGNRWEPWMMSVQLM